MRRSSCYQVGSVLSITQEAPRQRSSAEGEPLAQWQFYQIPLFSKSVFYGSVSRFICRSTVCSSSLSRVCVCVCLCDGMKCETFLGDILYRIFLFLVFVSLSFLCFHLEAHQQLFFPPSFSLSSVSRSHFRSQLKASVLGVCRLITVLSERRLAQISCAPTFPRLFQVKAFCGYVGKSKS